MTKIAPLSIRESSFVGFLITVSTFLSLNPFYAWAVPSHFLFLLIFLLNLVASVLLFRKRRLAKLSNKRRVILALALMSYVAYITLPFQLYGEFRPGHLIWFSSLFFLIWFPSNIIVLSYNFLYRLFVFISIWSLAIFLLTAFGFNLPSIRYDPSFRISSYDYYDFYLLSSQLRSNASLVMGLSRNSGIFAEPGHYAMFLLYFLIVERMDLRKFSNKVLFVSGLSTFSTFFLIMCPVIYIIYNFKTSALLKKCLLASFASFFAFMFFHFFQLEIGEFFESVVLNKLPTESIGNVRLRSTFSEDYDSFIRGGNVITGYGYSASEATGTDVSSSYHYFIYRFGLIGLSLLFLSLFFLTVHVRERRVMVCLLIFFITIFMHRSWFVLLPSLYVLMIYSIQNFSGFVSEFHESVDRIRPA